MDSFVDFMSIVTGYVTLLLSYPRGSLVPMFVPMCESSFFPVRYTDESYFRRDHGDSFTSFKVHRPHHVPSSSVTLCFDLPFLPSTLLSGVTQSLLFNSSSTPFGTFPKSFPLTGTGRNVSFSSEVEIRYLTLFLSPLY